MTFSEYDQLIHVREMALSELLQEVTQYTRDAGLSGKPADPRKKAQLDVLRRKAILAEASLFRAAQQLPEELFREQVAGVEQLFEP